MKKIFSLIFLFALFSSALASQAGVGSVGEKFSKKENVFAMANAKTMATVLQAVVISAQPASAQSFKSNGSSKSLETFSENSKVKINDATISWDTGDPILLINYTYHSPWQSIKSNYKRYVAKEMRVSIERIRSGSC